jgi:hypothetical protein
MKKGASLLCCIKDESRPLDFGDQPLESNHPVRHRSKAFVVSDREKAAIEPSGAYSGDERK